MIYYKKHQLDDFIFLWKQDTGKSNYPTGGVFYYAHDYVPDEFFKIDDPVTISLVRHLLSSKVTLWERDSELDNNDWL